MKGKEAFGGAVLVQPLASTQVDTYLAQAGKSLGALRRTLNANPALQELARTPLMLNIMIQTYQGTTIRELTQKEAQLQQQVWIDYVQRMVKHKGNVKRYPLEQTCSWLRWLAQQMRAHNQTVFYLEHLQPDWLPFKQQHAYNWLAVHFPAILIGILAGSIVALFFGTVDSVSLSCSVGFLEGFSAL